MKTTLNEERQRLEAQHEGKENWRLWGPYLAERAWGTVREDYSEDGTAWEYFDHDQARSRAYRWNEDGMGGICDEQQRAVLRAGAVERPRSDPEGARLRAHRQPGQSRRGREGVLLLPRRHALAQLDALSLQVSAGRVSRTAGWSKRTAAASRHDPPFTLLDTGVFNDGRYFDVEVRYAKASPEEMHIRVIATNRGPEAAPIHLIPHAVVPQHVVLGRSGRQAGAARDPGAQGRPVGGAGRSPDARAPTISTAATRPRRCTPRTRATRSACGTRPTPRPT